VLEQRRVAGARRLGAHGRPDHAGTPILTEIETMRWRGGRRSRNVIDRRGQRVSGGLKIGGGAGLLLLVAMLLLGGDPSQLLQLLGSEAPTAPAGTESAPPPEDETGQFLSAVLAMTEDVWTQIFAADGATYQPPSMVLFSQAVQSACGYGTAATGPFYCPADQRLYLDTSFFQELARMGGPGDFAQAYVVGHEVGHHVQRLTGTADRVRRLQAEAASEVEANRLQVAMELQADCYAGVWAHHANRRRRVLEPGDVGEGLAAAAAIGDDRLQRQAGRAVTPESFTHGSSEQRQSWLQTGLETGSAAACDTFGARAGG
jgi:predicted metalloprotease